MQLWHSLFAVTPLILQKHSFFLTTGLMWLHITSDSLITVSYYCIPLTLVYFVQKRKDLPFAWVFLLFSAFIVFCGTTHLVEVWSLWHPNYWLSGCLKALTALVSVYTALRLLPVIPKALALPNPQLEKANHKREAEICERSPIEEKLRWQGDIEEHQLAEKEQQTLAALVESSSDFIALATLEGQILFLNEAGQKLVGIEDIEQVKGITLSDCLLPEDLGEFQQKILPVVMEQGRWEEEFRLRHFKTNDTIPVYCNIFTIKDRQTKEAIALATVTRNITERKRVEEELLRSEARYRELASREALLNRLASQIRSSLELNTILKTAVQEIRDLLQVDRCLFIWYRPDPEQPIWEVVQEARSSSYASMMSYSVPVSALGQLTERVFEKEITRVDNVRELTDPAERKFFFSVGYTALLALPIHTRSVKVGMVSCGHCSGPRPWRDVEVELLRSVADQIAIAIDQAELYKKSRIAAQTAQEQATKLEQTLHELQQTQAQLVQTEKMSSLGQLVAGVAHEINNPINFIYGNITYANQYAEDLFKLIQLYEKYYPNPVPEIQAEAEEIDLDFIQEDLPKILSSMKLGADRISQIILLLRNFSRLDEAELKEVDIHEGLDNTLLILSHRLQTKADYPAIQVIKEYGNLPLIQCYAGLLNQVFMSILTNAIDALEELKVDRLNVAGSDELNVDRLNVAGSENHLQPATSWIRIGTELLDSNQVRIRIADNGPGMTEEIQRKLFDPFFTTKPVGSGTGLGMSISYQIVVEKHGGQLECATAPGQGTEFIISIPIQQLHRSQS